MDRYFILAPELGVGYQSDGRALFQTGLGIGGGSYGTGFGLYIPRFIAGTTPAGMGTATGIGMRHGIAGLFLCNLLVAELAYQALYAQGTWRHDVLLLFGISEPIHMIALLFPPN